MEESRRAMAQDLPPLSIEHSATNRRWARPVAAAAMAVVLLDGSLALAAQAGAGVAKQSPSTHSKIRPHRRATTVHTAAAPPAPEPAPEAPPAPEKPKWPVNDEPMDPSVRWDSHGLQIEAHNSSLHKILDEVSAATGAKVEGIDADERVFGDYGPGQADDVISQLLHGSGYNVLMIGDQGQGTPRDIVLSVRSKPGGQPGGQTGVQPGRNAMMQEEDPEPEPEPEPPAAPALNAPPMGPPNNMPAQMMTPQQRLMELQRQQIQMQQQQQQNQPQPIQPPQDK